jgi:hypothetical protein
MVPTEQPAENEHKWMPVLEDFEGEDLDVLLQK